MYFYQSAILKPRMLAVIYNPSTGGTIRGSLSVTQPALDQPGIPKTLPKLQEKSTALYVTPYKIWLTQ